MSDYNGSSYIGKFGVSYTRLLRNPMTPTGLSFVEGEPINGIEDLPLFKVQVHVFQNANQAQAFVSGMTVVEQPNKVAYTWEEGTSSINAMVIVGLLQDEVAADCPYEERVFVVKLAKNDMDTNANKRFYEKLGEERTEAANSAKAEANERFAPLAALGFKLREYYSNALYVTDPNGIDVKLHFEHASKDGPYSIEFTTPEFTATKSIRGNDIGPALDKEIAKTRCRFGTFREQMNVFDVGMDDVPAAVTELVATKEAVEAARRAAFQEDFLAGFKMTASRKRFIDQLNKFGGRQYEHRRNTRAKAGSEDIGATELHDLLRSGWIEAGKTGGLRATDIGLQKAGLVRLDENNEGNA
jgi:hypothetical protein